MKIAYVSFMRKIVISGLLHFVSWFWLNFNIFNCRVPLYLRVHLHSAISYTISNGKVHLYELMYLKMYCEKNAGLFLVVFDRLLKRMFINVENFGNLTCAECSWVGLTFMNIVYFFQRSNCIILDYKVDTCNDYETELFIEIT